LAIDKIVLRKKRNIIGGKKGVGKWRAPNINRMPITKKKDPRKMEKKRGMKR